MVKNPPASVGDRFTPWVGKMPWRRTQQSSNSRLRNSMDRGAWQATGHGSKSQGHNLAVKSQINALNGEGTGTPLQYSCLENPMDGGACRLQSMGLRRVRHN